MKKKWKSTKILLRIGWNLDVYTIGFSIYSTENTNFCVVERISTLKCNRPAATCFVWETETTNIEFILYHLSKCRYSPRIVSCQWKFVIYSFNVRLIKFQRLAISILSLSLSASIDRIVMCGNAATQIVHYSLVGSGFYHYHQWNHRLHFPTHSSIWLLVETQRFLFVCYRFCEVLTKQNAVNVVVMNLIYSGYL